MLKKSFSFYILISLLTFFSVVLVSGCATTSFKVTNQAEDVKLQNGDTVLICASTFTDQDFTKTVLDNVEEKLKTKKINVVVYPEVFVSKLYEDSEDGKAFLAAKECNADYVIELFNVTCSHLTGYMPPSVVTEPYTYYVNGKLQVGTRTVSKPGYYYPYFNVGLEVRIINCSADDDEKKSSVLIAKVNTSGTENASEKTVSKAIAKKIVKKITK